MTVAMLDWVELIAVGVVALVVIPVYRYLYIYTRLLADHRKAILEQADAVSANQKLLESLAEFVHGESQVLATHMDKLGTMASRVDENARELLRLREGIGMVAQGFSTIHALVEALDSEDSEDGNSSVV
jgi:hypothetical protein